MSPAVLVIAQKIGELAIEQYTKRSAREATEAEALATLEAMTAAWRPKPTAEAIAEGAAMAGGEVGDG